MKLFGLEFKFNNFDIWHKGNFDPNSKANSSHTHTKSNITDFPSSMPANGGNADTIDNKHATDLQYKDGTNYYPIGATGSGLSNIWYKVFTWTVSSQYNGIQTEILLNKRGNVKQDAVLHIRAEYGASTWQTYEFYITGYELSSEDTFLLAFNNAAKTITLYYKRNGDWNITLANIISQYLTGASFVYNNTSTGSTIQPTDDVAILANSTTSNYYPYWTKNNFDPSTKANASHTHTKSQITDMPTKLSQFSNDIGAGGGVKITTSAAAPTTPSPGDFWYKEL